MKVSHRVQADNLEHSELQLSIFVSVTMMVLAVGIAVLMYPLVFSHETPDGRTMRTAFGGFCGLCVLLTVYLWDRHATIRRLRREVAEDRRQIAETRRQASVELLKTMPNFGSFHDRLPMEFRRMASTTQKLSISISSSRQVNRVLQRALRHSAVPPRSSLEGCVKRIPFTFWLQHVLVRSYREGT